MNNNKTSQNEKNEHAVIVCSIIGKQNNFNNIELYKNDEIKYKTDSLQFINLNQFLSKIPYEESLEDNEEEYMREEDFKRLKEYLDGFLENKKQNPLNNWLPIVIEEENYYCHIYPLLGKYLPNEKKIILYIKNIEMCIKDGTDVKKSELFNTVRLHEMLHAYFHYVTEQKKCSYNYIFEIEEAMTEFCSLVCLEDLCDRGSIWKEYFDFAKKNIEKKQNEYGKLAAYGFGAYLFEKLKKDERYELINNYIQKLGTIIIDDDKVKEYRRKVLLPKFVKGNQKHCLNLLKEILEPTAN